MHTTNWVSIFRTNVKWYMKRKNYLQTYYQSVSTFLSYHHYSFSVVFNGIYRFVMKHQELKILISAHLLPFWYSRYLSQEKYNKYQEINQNKLFEWQVEMKHTELRWIWCSEQKILQSVMPFQQLPLLQAMWRNDSAVKVDEITRIVQRRTMSSQEIAQMTLPAPHFSPISTTTLLWRN